MIAAALTAILLPALAACGCSKKAPAGKQAASRDDGQIVALQNQSRYKSRVELRDALASQVICPQHNIDLLTDQKLNPDCGMRRQIIILVDRMIDTGWSLEEIEDALSLIRQGQSLMTVMRNEKSCAPMGGAKIDIFLMSHCPYGLRYTQEILPKMVRDFGESLAFVPHFIVDF